jgi:hypothetical protein
MARFFAIEAFDISRFDLNWYSRNYFDETLMRGQNERIDGTLYRDFLVLNGFNAGSDFYDDYYLTVAGSGITGSIDRGTISGTVTLMAEVSADTDGCWCQMTPAHLLRCWRWITMIWSSARHARRGCR